MDRVDAAGATRAEEGPVVRLQLTQRARIDPARVPEVLGRPTAPWLGEPVSVAGTEMRSFLCDMELHSGGAERTLFRKSAVVSLGVPASMGDDCVVSIEWHAATLTPLFPVLSGQLRIDQHGIVLDGLYAPPGGRIGYALDKVLLRKAARATGRWFLRRLAQELHPTELSKVPPSSRATLGQCSW